MHSMSLLSRSGLDADPAQVESVASRWTDTARGLLEGMVSKMAAFVPNLIGMLALLLIGWLVSKGARKLVSALLGRIGFDTVIEKVGLGGMLARANMRKTSSQLVGELVFWFFMLTFLVSAAESIGLESVSKQLNAFVAFLPNVLVALVMIVVGMMVAGFVKGLVQSSASSMGIDFGGPLSNIAYALIMVIVGSLAFAQLQVQTALFNSMVQIAFVATAGALALSLGLGTRDLAKQIVAGTYVRDLYEPGVEMTVGDDVGRLVEVGAVTTVLEREDGERVYVPNDLLTDVIVRASGEPDGRADEEPG